MQPAQRRELLEDQQVLPGPLRTNSMLRLLSFRVSERGHALLES